MADAVLKEHGPRIGPMGVAVFAALALHRDKNGTARPSYERIAKLLRVGRRTVIRTIKRLVDAGLVVVERQCEDGCHQANRYRLLDLPCGGGGGVILAPLVSERHQGGVPGTPGVVSERHQGGVILAPEPYQENQTNKNHTLPAGESERVFDQFWEAYPKKEKRDNARREWRKLKPSPEVARTILEAVERQKASPEWTREEGRYVPQPDKWLREKRFEDGPSSDAGRVETAEEYAHRQRQRQQKYGFSPSTNGKAVSH
jgi:hypothetical protein